MNSCGAGIAGGICGGVFTMRMVFFTTWLFPCCCCCDKVGVVVIVVVVVTVPCDVCSIVFVLGAFEGLCCFSRAWTANEGDVTSLVPGSVSITMTRFDLW